MSYKPKQGDIIFLDFNPQTGHGTAAKPQCGAGSPPAQKGRRPAIVVSNEQFHIRTNLALVCPITNTISDFPMHIKLDNRTTTTGEIMCEQAKCLDINARNALFSESAPEDVLDNAIDLICAIVE